MSQIKITEEHIYYRSKSFYDVCNDKYYTLDMDDITKYGPETVTFFVVNSAFDEFEYYVYNYWSGDKNELSHSGARVAIYYGEQEVRVVNVPVEGQGRTWNVFRIVDGEIIIENTIT